MSSYKMNQTLQSNFEQIRLALLKSPSSRSFDDLLSLRSFVFRIEYLLVEEYSTDDIIYRQGENCDKLYFVIDGNFELRVKYRVDLTKDAFEERERIEHRPHIGACMGTELLDSLDRRLNSCICMSSKGIVITVSKHCLRMLQKEMIVDGQQSNLHHKPDTKDFVLSVLSKCRHRRTAFEIDAVAKFLKARIPFFDKFNLDQQQEICRIAESVSLPERKIVFKQGQIGQAFYIVLKGSVDVLVATSEHSNGGSIRSGASIRSQSSVVNIDGYGEQVHTISVGDTFGDRALESDTALRTATVISSEALTELLVIYKEDYYSIVSVLREKDSMEKIVLLRKSPVFKNADMSLLKALAKVMSPRTYRLDEVLYREGDRAMDMIIISVGECYAEVEIHSEKEEVQSVEAHYLQPKGARSSPCNSRASFLLPNSADLGNSAGSLGFPSSHSGDHDSISSGMTSSLLSRRIKRSTVNVGRLGPASVLAPCVALCESVVDEVYHKETVCAATLLQTYVVFKNDFIHHVHEPVRSGLRKLLKGVPTFIVPELWDLHTASMGEQEWKAKKAWDLFKKDIRIGRGNIKTSITTKLASLKHTHRTDERGHRLRPARSSDNTMTMATAGKLASTLAGFTTAFIKRSNFERAEIKRLTSSFKDDELVDKEIAASRRRIDEKAFKELMHSQPDIRMQMDDNTDVKPTEVAFGSSRKMVTFNAPSTVGRDGDNIGMFSSETLTSKGLVISSHFPVSQEPYALVHIHRDCDPASKGAIMPRVSYCYFRLSGTMKTLIDVKDCAARQMKHAYISCLTHDTDISQDEIILDWKTFSSFDNMNVSNTDYFIAYFRSAPMEFASFTPKVNLLNKKFPAEGKPIGQRFACAKFQRIVPSGNDGLDKDLTLPKYIQELGVVTEVIATSFTISDCCRHLLETTALGKDIRRKKLGVLTLEQASLKSPSTAAPVGKMNRQDTSLTDADLDDNESEVDQDKHYFCVVPLFQWISMAAESFESMRLENLVFNEESLLHLKATTNAASEEDPEEQLDTISSPGSYQGLRNSLKEAGLLPIDETQSDIIERQGIRRNADEMRSTPGIKTMEQSISRGDFSKEIDGVSSRTRTLLSNDLAASASLASIQRAGKPASQPRPISQSLNSRGPSRNSKGVGSSVIYDDIKSIEEKAQAMAIVAQARTAVVNLNDDFCFGELYTPLENRGLRFPSASVVRLQRIQDEDAWNPEKLCQQSRTLRQDLEETSKKSKFRHNPIVSTSVDRGAAEGHIALLDAVLNLPNFNAGKKDGRLTADQKLKHSTSVTILDNENIPQRHLQYSGSTPSIPVSMSLSSKLDTLQELFNDKLSR